ncbi:cytochrome c maturation protein CcmE [Pseudonocardia sp. MH-G8]|uniref:cytochrome c maturation protein CcmE domain-containing protein n=1 Tax=Pseudonocardia sp. MH-G8 TaxID=1854588 RepID=UPI001E610919|nr:cytochrome c maturation protein CcmE [Pseudonocardia sp. MH-G8]
MTWASDGTRASAGALTRYRLLAVAALGVVAVLVGLLLFGNLNRNLVYYLTPDEAVARPCSPASTRSGCGRCGPSPNHHALRSSRSRS